MEKKIISVWPDGDKFIVSRDAVEAEYGPGNNTGSIHSATLEVVGTEAQAIAIAGQHAAESGLPIYRQDSHGTPERIG